MRTPDAKRIADKYIGRTGGAPEPAPRIKNPTRIGGEFLGSDKLRHVAVLFEFSETIITKGHRGFLSRGDMAAAASDAQKALAQLLGVPESDLRSAVALYLKQSRP
ncbi:hypothetical protein [Methylosinus sp. LW4]|uniref:hypothetical protein n=1 Tax=Methylosinus sp. LW4 TaxID=136993 RepID=UPI00037E8730|nr:hypothetical protein [Methylosinus sp. LW4]